MLPKNLAKSLVLIMRCNERFALCTPQDCLKIWKKGFENGKASAYELLLLAISVDSPKGWTITIKRKDTK